MPLDPWRLTLLVQFSTVETVRGVAETLHVSASTVSQQLSALEAEVGVDLFAPSGRGIRLTDAGRLLVTHGRAILDHMDAAKEQVRESTGSLEGTVRIGSFPSALRRVVIPTVRRLAERRPGLFIEILELEPEDSLRALARGDVDLAITADFVDSSEPVPATIETFPITTDELVLVVPRTQSGPSDRATSLAAFADHPWAVDVPGTYLSDLVLRLCRAEGFEPRVAGRFSSFGVLLRHVEAGLSVAVLPEWAVDDRFEVTTRPLKKPQQRQILGAIRRATVYRRTVLDTIEALRFVASTTT